MKRLIGYLFIAALMAMTYEMSASRRSEAKKVRYMIDNVNTHWQTTNKAESNQLWSTSVYHIGNMDAYKLTKNEAYRAYSEAWAVDNKWRGYGNDDKSVWAYRDAKYYSNLVLHADNQTCFQIYIDLYNIAPDAVKVARAKDVMGYQVTLPQNDFWYWSDALFMAMPVMTKMYRLTGDDTYLYKLYDYLKYTDSVMFDEDESLYYRDKRYVYPEHKSPNGKKDFWARGDGWVFAGLALVLKELPCDFEHYDFFAKKFRDMAQATIACQLEEGYWSRSLLDTEFASGPETSGTALIAYGLWWGINNGHLDKKTYLPAANKAWKFLSTVSYQENGVVGYVQPVGDRAIEGQVLDETSTANFGVGAFLLAASEYVRYLEK